MADTWPTGTFYPKINGEGIALRILIWCKREKFSDTLARTKISQDAFSVEEGNSKKKCQKCFGLEF
jgi:hypothetical protein